MHLGLSFHALAAEQKGSTFYAVAQLIMDCDDWVDLQYVVTPRKWKEQRVVRSMLSPCIAKLSDMKGFYKLLTCCSCIKPSRSPRMSSFKLELDGGSRVVAALFSLSRCVFLHSSALLLHVNSSRTVISWEIEALICSLGIIFHFQKVRTG